MHGDCQGVRSTLDSLVKTATVDGKGIIPPPPAGKNIWGSVTVGERGQIVIPKAVRDLFGLTGGQLLIVLTDESEGIALIPADRFKFRMKQAMEYASVREN